MRRHLVGTFALFHVAVVCVASSPAPDHDAFGPLSPLVQVWDRARRATVRGAHTYGDYLGPKQGWSMFKGVSTRNARVEVWILVAGDWRPVYVQRSAEATWRRRTFDHYRWREFLAVTARDREQDSWRRFVTWVAAEALADFPEAEAVRVQRTEAILPAPEAHAAGARMVFDRVVETDRVDR